jgi:hypothetical protein
MAESADMQDENTKAASVLLFEHFDGHGKKARPASHSDSYFNLRPRMDRNHQSESTPYGMAVSVVWRLTRRNPAATRSHRN